MPKSHKMEMADRAELLYCRDGNSYSEVAALTGVPLRTLKDWGRKGGWQQKRLENRRAHQEIRTKTFQLREKLIENCFRTLSARDALAVVSMESLARKIARDDIDIKKNPAPAVNGSGESERLENAIIALEKACHVRIGQLEADPEQLHLEAVRGLEAAFGLVGRLKSRLRRSRDYQPAQEFLEKAKADIRKKLLGMRLPAISAEDAKKNDGKEAERDHKQTEE
jgi:DNA-binding transcriptional MerR regulator